MSCLSRCPYFRGVLNEGFHCILVFDILVVQLNFQFVDRQSGTGGCTCMYEVPCYFPLSTRYDLLSFLLLFDPSSSDMICCVWRA